MPRRSDIASRLAMVIGLRRFEAAAAVGVSATYFDGMVRAGVMPQPKIYRSKKIWVVDELAAALDALPREGGESEGEADTWADLRCS